MNEIPQKNEEILVAESLPENKEVSRWELFDICFDWWNCPTRYPVQVRAFLESNDWISCQTSDLTPVELFDLIFEWLNNEYPYKMLEFMDCANGYHHFLKRLKELGLE